MITWYINTFPKNTNNLTFGYVDGEGNFNRKKSHLYFPAIAEIIFEKDVEIPAEQMQAIVEQAYRHSLLTHEEDGLQIIYFLH